MPEYPKHLAGFDYTGFHRYFLTFCTFERHMYFREAKQVELVCGQILRAASECGFALLAYCFMPDHAHLLASGECDDANLKKFVARAKQYSGFYFKKTMKVTLWQRYGFERVLRAEEDTPSIVRYIVWNPVRAGLVADPMEYPFWGSALYTRQALLEYIAQYEFRAG
jgi:REP-associated tyrosine transposase